MKARLIWWFERRSPQLALALGAPSVAVALAMQTLLLAPLEQQRLALRAQPARSAATQRSADDLATAESPQAQLGGFYAHFQPGVPLADGLERVHHIATRLGIELSRADYQLSNPAEQKLARYRMNVSLHANYPLLRRFVAAVLRDLPTLALDQIELQRKDIGDSELEARLSFSFYLSTP